MIIMTDEELKQKLEELDAKVDATRNEVEKAVTAKLEDIKDSFIEAVTPTATNKYGAWFLKGVTIFLLLLIVYRAFA